MEAVLAIEHLCFSQPWSRESFQTILADHLYTTAAARAGNRLVGYAVYSEVADEMQLLNLAVHPDHRREGVGSALLAHVHRCAFENGRTHAYLEVRESNDSAQKLYTKFGYVKLTMRRSYYADNNENALLMGALLEKKG